ncbi:uncharacterized protein [Miscanthus floridulus]|uniref:uncharacterized protein n=1 Tax=Miscanthus floridulus TaxID=154761 RepID=UPI0034576554
MIVSLHPLAAIISCHKIQTPLPFPQTRAQFQSPRLPPPDPVLRRRSQPSMDRRLRSPARRPAAERQQQQQPAGKGGGSPHRFLRPGALARLRDSRVLARSLRCAARARPPLPPPSSSPPRSPAPPAAAAWDGVPCFLGPAARGMRYPLRKKLAAARAVVFLPPPEVAEALVEAFAPPDVVAAH